MALRFYEFLQKMKARVDDMMENASIHDSEQCQGAEQGQSMRALTAWKSGLKRTSDSERSEDAELCHQILHWHNPTTSSGQKSLLFAR
jgi:hypothetical protein